MSKYAVAKLDEIAEIDDGREPMRPVRHHLGISAFGVNSWTGKNAGDRILNEHDEDEPDGNEELYFVHTGRARFELDGETVDAPAGSFVFAKPAVKRTAYFPDIPTIGEAGFPGHEVGFWMGAYAVAGTPQPVLDLLQAQIAKIMARENGKPFYALLQTLSNHTPYALPTPLPVERVTDRGSLNRSSPSGRSTTSTSTSRGCGACRPGRTSASPGSS